VDRGRNSVAWEERLLTLLVIAVTLALCDQYVKLKLPTQMWAFHHRSDLWFIGSCALLVLALPLSRLPSNLVTAAAGIFAGGVLGNLISAGATGLEVPNPLVIDNHAGVVAFNLADTFVLTGNVLLMAGLIALTLRYRDRLPSLGRNVKQTSRRRA
jgi:hypothetical protein